MADNFAFTPGAGATGAADDVGGVLIPRTKIVHGADGSNDGDVSKANGLPIGPAQAANYEGIVYKAYSFYTGSYQSLGLVNISTCRELVVTNMSNGTYYLSFDAGSTNHVVIPPFCIRTVNVKAGATQVHAVYAFAPTSGDTWFEVVR